MGTSEQSSLSRSGYTALCPKCGAEAHLQRTQKFPEFKGEVRIYECEICHHKAEVIVRD